MKKITLLLILVLSLTAMPADARGNKHRGRPDRHEQCDRRHRPTYMVSDNAVFFDGRQVKGASAFTFKILRDGYAADAWSVYYNGRKIKGANCNTFKVLRDGYATDAWTVYYDGRKVEEASVGTFKVMRDGYARDAWTTFYEGRKIK